jgi:thiol-disulfide isomerase/thioredoxin
MRQPAVTACLALAIAGGLALCLNLSARAEDRKPEEILKAIQSVEMPTFDQAKQADPKYQMEFLEKYRAAQAKRAELIGELYKVDPANAQIPTLLPQRWIALLQKDRRLTPELDKELSNVASTSKNPKLKADAAFMRVQGTLMTDRRPEAIEKAADEFARVAPNDERGAMLLDTAARMTPERAKKIALLKRIVASYPNSRAAKSAEGGIRQSEEVGKPFELEFTDAIKGTTVSVKGLKGKVVVVDFWATWCGPCVGEMPNMKKLYAEYKDKGVEFIGVSLDQPKEQGGLDKLKEFVAKNEITWPQYYLGGYTDGCFAEKWGVTSIPTVFVVDTEGKLHSVDARGKLEEMIPELLKKAKGSAGAGAGGQ